MVGRYNMIFHELVFMGFINQLMTGGHHPVVVTLWLFNIAMENHHF